PTAAIAALAAPLAVRLVFGADFLPAVPAFRILCVAMVLYGTNNILANYLASLGFPLFSLFIPAIGFLVNFVLNLVAIPHFGIVGAALCSVIGYGGVLALHVMYVFRRGRAAPETQNIQREQGGTAAVCGSRSAGPPQGRRFVAITIDYETWQPIPQG